MCVFTMHVCLKIWFDECSVLELLASLRTLLCLLALVNDINKWFTIVVGRVDFEWHLLYRHTASHVPVHLVLAADRASIVDLCASMSFLL